MPDRPLQPRNRWTDRIDVPSSPFAPGEVCYPVSPHNPAACVVAPILGAISFLLWHESLLGCSSPALRARGRRVGPYAEALLLHKTSALEPFSRFTQGQATPERGAINRTNEYRAKGFELLSLAETMNDPERRADMLRFAKMWMSLSEPMPDLPADSVQQGR
jgi:hypothetical protein